MKPVIFVLFLWCASGVLHSQSTDLLRKPWAAQWITGPGEPLNMWSGAVPDELRDYRVYKFRKRFALGTKPASFIIHVSGDNRYKFFVNEQLVALGPARGDLFHWNFETIDIAPYLQAGTNVLAAVVWNDGKAKPEAQVSHATAFIVQGNSSHEEIANTNTTWKSIRDESYQPLAVRVTGYYVAGPGELITMSRHVKGWERNDFDDEAWKNARQLLQGIPKGVFTFAPTAWMLVPSPLPLMEMVPQRMRSVRKASGISVPASFPKTKTTITIPANTRASVLIDQEFLTNAYPTLIFSKGNRASLSLRYAEALYVHKDENISGSWIPTMPKGNRNEVEGKVFIGKMDSVLSDGTLQQAFTPLWWRTYRYVLLTVQTKDEALVIDDLYGTFTGYPFGLKATFDAEDNRLSRNLEIGWRTARLCAFETYMDCPYYEQLQYIGDTRIQALVTLFNSGDNRMVKNAITLSDHSRLAEGITMSRYPTASTQIIPGFSLWWIGMVHDFWRYQPDEVYVKERLGGTREVLSFFHQYQQPDGSLKNVPYWIFTDWVSSNGWKDGIAPRSAEGESSILDLHLLWTYQLAAELENHLGLKELAADYEHRVTQLKNTIQSKYWDASRGLYADTPQKNFFSQHANALAILTRMINGEEAAAVTGKLLNDESLAPASIYYKYYLHQALIQAGLGDQYLDWLSKWNENIDMGLTTWAEMSDVSKSRSDCHAWGSSPNIEFFRTVLGIDSDAPGFRKVKIEPHLGSLKKVSGSIPHPEGTVAVMYAQIKSKWKIEVELPQAVSGSFVWKGESYPLKGGKNSFDF